MCYFVIYRSHYISGEHWSPCTHTIIFSLCVFVRHTEKAPDTARFLIWSLSPYTPTVSAYPDQYNSDLSTQTVEREGETRRARAVYTSTLSHTTRLFLASVQQKYDLLFSSLSLSSLSLAAQWLDTKRNKWWWQSTLLLILIDFFWVRRLARLCLVFLESSVEKGKPKIIM